MASKLRWVPLESNPDVINKYSYKVGLPRKWQFVDVYSLDAETLATINQPVAAVILLFPTSGNENKYTIGTLKKADDSVYFMKQTIRNACGTVALIHALANNTDTIPFTSGKPLTKFLAATKSMSPEERADYLEDDEDLGSAHGEYAREGQTETPSDDESVTNHFVTFVAVGTDLIEFNGRCDGPIYHGATSKESFLEDAAAVVRKFMERDPEEVNFTVMALVPA